MFHHFGIEEDASASGKMLDCCYSGLTAPNPILLSSQILLPEDLHVIIDSKTQGEIAPIYLEVNERNKSV